MIYFICVLERGVIRPMNKEKNYLTFNFRLYIAADRVNNKKGILSHSMQRVLRSATRECMPP